MNYEGAEITYNSRGMKVKAIKTEQYTIEEEPYYLPLGREIELFSSAYTNRIPVLLKGPTGCGKTRFMQYMAWKFRRPLKEAGSYLPHMYGEVNYTVIDDVRKLPPNRITEIYRRLTT